MVFRTPFAAFAAVLAAVVIPATAQAQPQAQSEEMERRCSNFAWLLGTWESWDHRGGEFGRSRTGGTLIFTMSAGGSVSGRIGNTNAFMDEYGYAAGMLVFRGFTESVAFTPGGSSAFDARNGQFFHLDKTNPYDDQAKNGYWRDDLVSLRHADDSDDPSGLYLTPTAVSLLGGHAKWRKLSTGTRLQAADACNPGESVPAVADASDAAYPDYPDWRTLLGRTRLDPPVLLNPLAPPTDECLQIAEGREQRPSNILTRHRDTQDQLDQLSGYGSLLSQPDLDPESRASFARSYLRVMRDVLDDYHALHAARLIEQDAGRRAGYSEKIRAIEEQVKIGDETRRFLQDWDAGAPLPDDVFEQIDRVSLNPANRAGSPDVQMDRLSEEDIRREYQCMLPPFVVADPLFTSGSELDVHSVRNEQPPGLYPQRQDVETLLEEAKGAARAMQEMGSSDPIFPALERLYSQYHRKLRIQQIGFAHLGLETADPEQRARYARQAQDIGAQLAELREPLFPEEVRFGGFDVFGTVSNDAENDYDLQSLFGHADLEDLMRRIGDGNATGVAVDAFLGSPQVDELQLWMRDNGGNVDSVEYDQDEGYLKITPNNVGLGVGID